MCVILYTNLKDKIILAKNRDRVYKPIIKIIHKIVNGIEIVYIHDIKSGWIEGINENGTAIINSTLNMFDDEINHTKKNKAERNKIYNTLCEPDYNKVMKHLISIEGHTFLYVNGLCYHIENNTKNEYVIKKAKINDVFTNHGESFKDEGHIKGKTAVSSYLRKKIMENEIKHNVFDSYDKISNTMNKNYSNIDPQFHPYRDKNVSKKYMKDKSKYKYTSTTGQLIMNVTDKELVYYSDKNNSQNDVKYINKLPKNYIPKIRIIVKETEKLIKLKYKMFTKKYISNIYKKFNYTDTVKN